jgi:tryptophan synthase alpha chain
MSRIAHALKATASTPVRGFIPFITAGDPDLDASLELAATLGESCADILELGVPFSDPVADGPVIQRSSLRALHNGATLGKVIELVRRLRQRSNVPVVLFSYFNPILQYGLERLAEEAWDVGVDGLLLTDLPPEESEAFLPAVRARGIDTIFLASPTTSPARMRIIAERSSGFIYLISRAGVTGTSDALRGGIQQQVQQLKEHNDLPVVVGFGISTPSQVRQVWEIADAAVVGSAIVRRLEESYQDKDWLEKTMAFANWLKGQGAE